MLEIVGKLVDRVIGPLAVGLLLFGGAIWVWLEAGWAQGLAVMSVPLVIVLLVLFWHPDDPTL